MGKVENVCGNKSFHSADMLCETIMASEGSHSADGCATERGVQ